MNIKHFHVILMVAPPENWEMSIVHHVTWNLSENMTSTNIHIYLILPTSLKFACTLEPAYLTDLHIQKEYTSLGTSSMKILLLSAHACIHYA